MALFGITGLRLLAGAVPYPCGEPVPNTAVARVLRRRNREDLPSIFTCRGLSAHMHWHRDALFFGLAALFDALIGVLLLIGLSDKFEPELASERATKIVFGVFVGIGLLVIDVLLAYGLTKLESCFEPDRKAEALNRPLIGAPLPDRSVSCCALLLAARHFFSKPVPPRAHHAASSFFPVVLGESIPLGGSLPRVVPAPAAIPVDSMEELLMTKGAASAPMFASSVATAAPALSIPPVPVRASAPPASVRASAPPADFGDDPTAPSV